MPLPSYAAAQQSNVNPIEVQQQKDQNQKVVEILSNIENRLGNVTNFRSNVQTATFNAFGNNFLTRGITQLGDMIGESISSLFETKEEQKDDPTTAQLKNVVLTLKELITSNSKENSAIEDGLLQIRYDLKHASERETLLYKDEFERLERITDSLVELITHIDDLSDISHNDVVSQLNELDAIKKALDAAQTPNPQPVPQTSMASSDVHVIDQSIHRLNDSVDSVAAHITDLSRDMVLNFSLLDHSIRVGFHDVVEKLDTLNHHDDAKTDSTKIDKTDDSDDEKSVVVVKDEISKFSKDTNTTIKQESIKQMSFLKKMVTVLLSIDKHIVEFMSPKNISDQETDMENSRGSKSDKLSKLQDRNIVSDIQPGEQMPSDRSFFDGLFDIDANKRGLMNILKSIGDFMKKSWASIVGWATGLYSVISKFVGSIVETGAAMITKFKDIITGLITKVKNFVKGLSLRSLFQFGKMGTAEFLIAAEVGDYALGKTGLAGGNEIDEKKDTDNLSKLKPGIDRQSSLITRGAEYILDSLGLSNIANSAKKTRIDSETKAVEDRLAEIEKSQRELDAKRSSSGKVQEAAPVIINNNNSRNQTIMPSRQSVKNQESSFNRYLDYLLK